MLPEIELYFKSVNNYDTGYETARYNAERENPVPRFRKDFTEEELAAYFEADEKRQAAYAKIERERKETQVRSWRALTEHSDPLIKWLTTNREINRDFRSHRDTVLQNLPMTREEMEEFGDQQGWCGDYGMFLEQAEQAGVLPERTPELADISGLVSDFVSWYGGSNRRFERTIRKHLPAIIESYESRKAEREAAEKKVAEETVSVESTDTNGTTKNATPAPRRVRRPTTVLT